MTTPPNYRRVECCGNCRHGDWDYSFSCKKYIIYDENENICDDYEPEDEE